jgi:hypothetical protein
MRIEFMAAGRALVWELNKRAMVRAEIALGMGMREISQLAAKSEIIQAELFGQALCDANGQPLTEAEIQQISSDDPEAIAALVERVAASKNVQPVKAPSPANSKRGARPASIQKPSGA